MLNLDSVKLYIQSESDNSRARKVTIVTMDGHLMPVVELSQ
jgi:hypothetical protein